MSPGNTEGEARQLVAKNHCCQIPASPLTNLSDLCHLSHKTASKLHLLNSATAIEFLNSSNEVACLYPSQYICVSKQPHNWTLQSREEKCYNATQKTQMLCVHQWQSYKLEPRAALRNDMHRRTDTAGHTRKHTNIRTRHWHRDALGVVSRAWQGNTRQPRFQEHTEGSKAESGAWPRYVSRIECQEISPNSSLGVKIYTWKICTEFNGLATH